MQAVCITPIDSIPKVLDVLRANFELTYLPDCTAGQLKALKNTEVIFTNPNRTKLYLGENTLSELQSLKVICTASTGTIHIDLDYCQQKRIDVISLKKELSTLEKISSTAELAFAMTMMAIRNIPEAMASVQRREWDYTPYVGRQMNALKIGVLGYGRLGKMYANYCRAFGSEVLVCDPDQSEVAERHGFEVTHIESLFSRCDVVSIHIHAEENIDLINGEILKNAREPFILINTSRGEIINDQDLVEYLLAHPASKYATDVLTAEYADLCDNKLINFPRANEQLYITPHMGGMTSDAQNLAYLKALDLLEKWLLNHR